MLRLFWKMLAGTHFRRTSGRWMHARTCAALLVAIAFASTASFAQVSRNRNLSDRFAAAATRAVAAIQVDTGTDRSNPTPKTLRAIQDADAEADTAAEKSLSSFLNNALAQKAIDNDRRRITSASAGARNQNACFNALLNQIRVREFHSPPVACQIWTDPAGSGSQVAEEEPDAQSSSGQSTGGQSAPDQSADSGLLGGGDSGPRAEPQRTAPARVRSETSAGGLGASLTEVAGWRALMRKVTNSRVDPWIIDHWWIFVIIIAVPIMLNIFFTRHALDGRLVVVRAGVQVAEVDFRDFNTQKFSVYETAGMTRCTDSDLSVATGGDSHLFTLRMRKSGGRWKPYLVPMEARLLDNGHVLGFGVMPKARFVFIDGKQLKFIYYY